MICPWPWRRAPPQKNFGSASRPMESAEFVAAEVPGPNPWLSRVAGDPLHHRETVHGLPFRVVAPRPPYRADQDRRYSCKTAFHVKGFFFLQHGVTRSRQFVRPRLGRDRSVRPGFLAFVETLGLLTMTLREVGRFDECPGKVLVAVPDLPSPFFLPLLPCTRSTQRACEANWPTPPKRSIVPTSNRMAVASVWTMPGIPVSKHTPYACPLFLENAFQVFDLTVEYFNDRDLGPDGQRHFLGPSDPRLPSSSS